MYINVKSKFILTCCMALIWTVACFYIDRLWFNNLVATLSLPIAIIVVFGIAIIPGVMICFFTLGGLFFDKPRHIDIIPEELEDLTICIAAYNEEDCIYDTIKSISLQNYPKQIYIKVIDNNSKDNTKVEIERAIKDFPQLAIEYMFEQKQGKYAALNHALPTIQTNHFITIDADTYLYKNAIINLTNRMIQENKNKKVVAVAGTILVRNSRENLLTKMQEWEYFLSIATIKRTQGLFQTTMVAQGAFSIYNTQLIQEIGGYKDTIAEDIVLTWEMLSAEKQKEYFQDNNSKDMALTWELLNSGKDGEEVRTYYCDDAIAFTKVPTTFAAFARQRRRWARGSIEGFRHFKFKKCNNPYTKFYMFVNYVNMIGEIATTFILIPGIIMAIFFHNFLFISWCTILMFLATAFFYILMWHKQMKYVFDPLGLKVRRHYLAFIMYMLVYAILLAPICLHGYVLELLRMKRKWK